MISEDFKESFIEYLTGMLDILPSIRISTTGMDTDVKYIESEHTIKTPISIGAELIEFVESKGFFVVELFSNSLYSVSISC